MKTEAGYKSVSTSKITQRTESSGVRVVDVAVETMPGISTEMLVWWFHHFDRMTNWNGRDFSGPERLAYRVWHPRDHISVTQVRPGRDAKIGGCAAGATIRIQEKLLCKYDFDATVFVAQCDQENLVLIGKLGPIQVVRIDHFWRNAPDGCDMVLRVTVGTRLPIIGSALNWLIRRFVMTDEMLGAAGQHATEEFGNLQNFLPQFFANPDELRVFPGAAWK